MTTTYACSVPDLLVFLPYHLGFHPSRCLVVVGLRQGTMDLVERVDLPAGELDDLTLARLTGALRRRRVESCVVVAFTDDDAPTCALSGLVRHLDTAFRVVRAVEVRRDRWRDAGARMWSPLPEAADVPLVAEYVGRGVAPLTGRDAIRQSFAYREDADLRRRLRRADVPTTFAAQQAWLAVLEGEADSADLVVALAALRRTDVRDDVLEAVVPLWCDGPVRAAHPVTGPVHDDRAARRARLVGVVQVAPPEVRAAALCVLALWCWDAGDGASAAIAVDEALAADESYTLARLVSQVICLDIRPPAA